MTKLVVVESPTKARTIARFLPPGHLVEASMGHVRDLPASAAEIPKTVRDQSWAQLGIDVENGFRPLYVVSGARREVVRRLKKALGQAEELIIATDEDREGESIGWHVVEVLEPSVPVRRMVFHEITESAIRAALAAPRALDLQRVRAQETRRILDRLVGYTLSPLLWRKIRPRLSAGRVQSVAVRLLVERERERRAFVSAAFWDLEAELAKQIAPSDSFRAVLVGIGGQPVASGKDFDPRTGRLQAGSRAQVLDGAAAEALRERLLKASWRVTQVELKDAVRRPYPPFTTSTLQQEAARKLGLSTRETMRLAQELYENGHITYHRTDSVVVAEEAIGAIRRRIEELYGRAYLSPAPRRYRTRSKGAQEAHEAIRPAGVLMPRADELGLSGRHAQLYDLIWKRSLATQMADARLVFSTVQIAAEDALFRASGRHVRFAGFFRAYVEGSDDPEGVLEDREAPLPELSVGEELQLIDLLAAGHETKPPPRYTEAALVKILEAEGIGRPSTYATIIGTIQDRGYVVKQRQTLVPTYTAFAVTALLEREFADLVDERFTARMEADLDRIEEGEVEPTAYLTALYKGETGLAAQVAAASERVDPREASTVDLGDIQVRIGRYGPYIEVAQDGQRVRVAIPEDIPPADLRLEDLSGLAGSRSQLLGHDPSTGEPIYLKEGPYGAYVQRGENAQDGGQAKPKRSAVPKTLGRAVDLERALALLALPRELGPHPESGQPVRAGIGRFGPYVVHDGTFASLGKDDDVLTVGLERALALLTAKAERASRRGAGARTNHRAPTRRGGKTRSASRARRGTSTRPATSSRPARSTKATPGRTSRSKSAAEP